MDRFLAIPWDSLADLECCDLSRVLQGAMLVGLRTTFAESKKEPLASMINRPHQTFLNAGLGEPTLRFPLSNPPLAGSVSSVGRVMNRFPEIARFLATGSPMAGFPGMRQPSNADSGHPIPFPSIEEIAAGVPRSLLFHCAMIHLYTQSMFFSSFSIGFSSAICS
jgi:hypothetical protein